MVQDFWGTIRSQTRTVSNGESPASPRSPCAWMSPRNRFASASPRNRCPQRRRPTFAKILDLLHRGGGPDDAFRPYLLTAVRRAAYDRRRAEHGPRGLVCPPRRSAGRPGGSDPHGGMDRTRSAILSVHPAPNRTPRGELLRRRHPLPCRRGRRHPLSPSRIPSTTTTSPVPAPRQPAPPVGLLGGAGGAGGAQILSRGACCARPRRRNVLEPRFQCVLTQ